VPTGGGCRFLWKVSYRTRLLYHLDSEPSGRTYRAWKSHASAVHLYTLRCRDLDGAVLLSDYRDPQRVGLAGWRMVSHDQWPRLEARLDAALAK